MSYRIYVNDMQCLGNNECPKVLVDELKRQGCNMDEDRCFHNFEIKELQPIISALEQYIVDANDWAVNKSYCSFFSLIIDVAADFTDIFEKDKDYGNGLTWRVSEYIECGYLFVTFNFLNVIKDDYSVDFSGDRITYKIKEGHHVFMSGY